MEKSSLPQLLGEVTKDSVTGFVNDTRFAMEAPGVINDLNTERVEAGLPTIELPSRARIIGESALRNSNGFIGGVVASFVLRTALKNIGKKIPIA